MGVLKQFINCCILRDHKIIKEDLWVRDGKILNPEKIFFDERNKADIKIDCNGAIIAPGFIELQINGGFGVDFTANTNDVVNGINMVSKKLLAHGVTSYYPTVISSEKEIYEKVLPHIKLGRCGNNGATILGVHCEGPFINIEKKGAHPVTTLKQFDNGMKTVEEVYGNLDNVKIITLAPELPNAFEVIKALTSKNIVVSMGHSNSNLSTGEEAAHSGATFVTHLFNAMVPFHHRDPGLIGLLTSEKLPQGKHIYYGIIADGIHTHPAALRIAYKANADGLVLVTDAISALGLKEGRHKIGTQEIEIKNSMATIAGTQTLCGSICSMNECVKKFKKETGCSKEYVLEAASLHPAQVMGIQAKKGTLNFNADADFILLDDELNVISTWIDGERVYNKSCI